MIFACLERVSANPLNQFRDGQTVLAYTVLAQSPRLKFPHEYADQHLVTTLIAETPDLKSASACSTAPPRHREVTRGAQLLLRALAAVVLSIAAVLGALLIYTRGVPLLSN